MAPETVPLPLCLQLHKASWLHILQSHLVPWPRKERLCILSRAGTSLSQPICTACCYQTSMQTTSPPQGISVKSWYPACKISIALNCFFSPKSMSPVLIIIGVSDASERLLTPGLGPNSHNGLRHIKPMKSKQTEVFRVHALLHLPVCQTGWLYWCLAKVLKEDCLLCLWVG